MLVPDAQPAAEVPARPVVGALSQVQASFAHGVCLLVETAMGTVVVPLSPEVCKDLPDALLQAQAAEARLQGMVSSASVH